MSLVTRMKTFGLTPNSFVFLMGSFSFFYTTVIALITKKEWRRILFLAAGIDIHKVQRKYRLLKI